MQHFILGFLTGLVVWVSAFTLYRIKAWDFPVASGKRGYILNALLWGVVGGVANLAVDIDFLIHQWLGFPYRFWHTPALIIGVIMSVVSVVYVWHTAPHSRRDYNGFLVLVIALSFVTHVLEDYLLGWF